MVKKILQKDVWEIIVEKHNAWSKPSCYNHVREVVRIIEKENNVIIPLEMIWKLDKRYQKWRVKEMKYVCIHCKKKYDIIPKLKRNECMHGYIHQIVEIRELNKIAIKRRGFRQ